MYYGSSARTVWCNLKHLVATAFGRRAILRWRRRNCGKEVVCTTDQHYSYSHVTIACVSALRNGEWRKLLWLSSDGLVSHAFSKWYVFDVYLAIGFRHWRALSTAHIHRSTNLFVSNPAPYTFVDPYLATYFVFSSRSLCETCIWNMIQTWNLVNSICIWPGRISDLLQSITYVYCCFHKT